MSIIDVSSKLGEYMHKGWVLTDEACPNDNCRVPLMRSPNGRTPVTIFCANCDGDPRSLRSASSISAESPSGARQSSPSTFSSGTRISRSSTPPTELSSRLSSPTFALPVETAESVRRRQQSDAASAEIGARLLKGWAMLADECPNERCYGIPLVRPPLVGGRDPRKECVVCGSIYISEEDADGWERLVDAKQQTPSGSTINVPSRVAVVGPSDPEPPRGIGKGKDTIHPRSSEINTNTNVGETNNIVTVPASSSQNGTLESSATSLELALQYLSQRLTSLTSHPGGVEPGVIGSTAEAMSKVLHTLAEVNKLRGDSDS